MDNRASDDRKRKLFLWGTILTWTLLIPPIIGVLNAFKGISEQKATGLGAVAGGIAEAYVTLGVVCALVLPVAAIVLLAKSFDAGHRMRAVFSVLYIAWSLLTLIVAGLFVWMSLIYPRHAGVMPR